MRQIVLDTETTGLDPKQGHRIIEIACVELLDRKLTGNDYQQYLQPDRVIDADALKVHGISNEKLADQPRFKEVAQTFIDYIEDSELIIHNAKFDVGFLNAELRRLGPRWGKIEHYCQIIDTLDIAKKKHPGQKVNLDVLCKRYGVDRSKRTYHGALLDSQLLAQVYLAMTGGQLGLFGEQESNHIDIVDQSVAVDTMTAYNLPIIQASEEELQAHQSVLELLSKKSGSELGQRWD